MAKVWLRKHWHWVVLFLLVLLGSFLRFYRLGTISNFSYDQARDTEIMREIIQEGKLTLLGPPTSISTDAVGYGTTYFGPVFYYLLAPSLLLHQMDPVGPMILTAATNVITILLVYFVIRRLNGSKLASLLGAGLYSVSPALVAHSRFIWNPNLIAPFSALLLLSLVLFLQKRRCYYLLAAGLFSGILIQLHFYNYFWVIFSIIYLIFGVGFLKKIRPVVRRILLYSLGLIVGLFPMLLFDIRHNFLNSRSIWYNLIHSSDVGRSFGISISHLLLTAESLLDKFLGLDYIGGYLALVFWLIVLGLFWQGKKKQERQVFSFLGLLFLIGFLGSSIFDYQGRIDTRYLLPFAVAFFVFLAISLGQFIKGKSWFVSTPVILLIGFLLLNSIWVSWAHVSSPQSFSLQFARDTAEIIMTDAQETDEKNINVANLYNTQRRAISFRYFFRVKDFPIMGVKQYPDADTLYVIDKEYSWTGIKNNTDTWEVYSFKPKKLEKIIFGPCGSRIYKIRKK